jgi:hypothetical protein
MAATTKKGHFLPFSLESLMQQTVGMRNDQQTKIAQLLRYSDMRLANPLRMRFNQANLRKLLSILLLAVFGLPVAAPLFAGTAEGETRLPACCRKNGKHHCMMNTEQRSQLAQNDPQFSAPAEKCPYYPQAAAVSHTELYTPPIAEAIFASLVSHPSGVAQTESKRRISRDRSRLKRGPPTLSLL